MQLSGYLIKYLNQIKNVLMSNLMINLFQLDLVLKYLEKFFLKHLKSDNSKFAKEHVTFHMLKKKVPNF